MSRPSNAPGLVVFPSNDQLALRAHGMAPATLRRHLAVLVDCGLLIRRDSPNGKRYARKGQGGVIETAFGFDLTPLVARAAEFERLAEAARAERRAYLVVREGITLVRRDIAKMIAAGAEEGVRWRLARVSGGLSGPRKKNTPDGHQGRTRAVAGRVGVSSRADPQSSGNSC